MSDLSGFAFFLLIIIAIMVFQFVIASRKRKRKSGKVCVIVACKEEPFIEEFCDYYLSQGADMIFVFDDKSVNQAVYKNLNLNPSVRIIRGGLQMQDGVDNHMTSVIEDFYNNEIRPQYEWCINVDADEFITTKRDPLKTIKDELKTTFRDVDCIKVPWVMMAHNQRKKNPKSLLLENTWRWCHDKEHKNQVTEVRKFRCRFEAIEVKSIFKTEKFGELRPHTPIADKMRRLSIGRLSIGRLSIVDSINFEKQGGGAQYVGLREKHISEGHLVCYHYRIYSEEHALQKINTSAFPAYRNGNLAELLSCDYAELEDKTMQEKFKRLR